MAFTKVTGPGVSTTSNYRVGVLTATKFVGPMEASGTSDFTNINVTGVATVGFLTATDVWVSGAVTATTYHGSGANLTGIAGGVAGINTVGLSTFKDILVSGISTFKGDVLWDNSTNAGKDILWDESDNSLNFSENVSIKLNDSSGGQNASLSNGGSGLSIAAFSGGTVKIAAAGGTWIRNQAGEFNIKCNPNASTDLYYANVKTLETVSGGAKVTGDITISDKIIHDGDTNTAIRFPAADTITAETGGTERVRIDSSGRTGFGVVPNATFSENARITIQGTGTNESIYSNINGTGIGTHFTLTNGSSARCRIGTNGTSLWLASNNNSEQLRLDPNGRLLLGGIGNTESDVRLYVHNSGAAGSQLQFTGNGSGTGNSDGFRVGYNGSGGQLWLFENQYVRIATNNAERLRIQSDGKIGVNRTANMTTWFDINHGSTSTPETNLMLSGSAITAGGGTGIFLKSSSNTTLNRYGTRIHSIREASNNGASSLVISNENAGASGLVEALRITSAGTVGINNTPSTGTFTVKNINDSSHNALECINDNGNVVSGFSQASDGDGSFFAKLNNGTLTHYFRSDNVSYINNTQAFIMGASSGIANCKYGGSGVFGPRYQMLSNDTSFGHGLGIFNFRDGSGNPAIPALLRMGLSRNDTTGSNGRILNNDTVAAVEFMGNDGTQFVDCVRIDAQVDGAPNTNDMPGRLVILTTSDNSSTVTERLRITSYGHVKIPDDGKFVCGAADDLQIHHTSSVNHIRSHNGDVVIGTQGNHRVILGAYYNAGGGGDTVEVWGGANFLPATNDAIDLGENSHKWDDIYATNGSIQTSDQNNKDNIVTSDLGLTFVNKLSPKSYKFKGKTRTHYGLIAQDVETVLSDISKPTSGFGGFIKTDVADQKYDERDQAHDRIPSGKAIGDVKIAAHTEYGLRYTEFVGPLIKAVQELSAEVETLKTEVAALKAA